MSDVKFIDASGWNEQFWLNSGGTRAKKILLDNEAQSWFFKCSEKKEAKDNKPAKHYRYEFWSEVLAYQLGKAWGLNILRYDPAVFGNEIGCISKSMHQAGQEQLIEVGRFMTAISDDFLPAEVGTRDQYTFQLLSETLDHFELAKYWDFFFKTMLFDAVIGNTDRHQENWAFIGRSSIITRSIDEIEKEASKKPVHLWNWFLRTIAGEMFNKGKNTLNKDVEQIRLHLTNIVGPAPIYDSGSSMARELNDERVEALLSNENQLLKYVNEGKAEVHWKNKKLSHFGLVLELMNSSYIEEVRKAGSFLSKIDAETVKNIVNEVDASLPEAWKHYKIPNARKELIYKLVTSRAEKLKGLLS